ncbi:hypothetical protein MTR62_18610 [Novosphingobium sp. 1949]|uniref:Uncharacterized protein n=1 Tax=Novosphingobium organovorum TaxID=2930092 RepID=A0ABT0BI35_9SPHN|nr:hypothetical protein [Novosphingobium organovorum]MCJ2184684.1 hypothetical protein [Novosphingobium organovorum]
MTRPDEKQRRMEVRRSVGNRKVPGPDVVPYHRGADYLIAHACFDCRTTWKRSGDREHTCPECGNALALMGRTFRTPAKREDDQWEKARRLWAAGFRFWSYRSFPEAEPFPEQLREVDAFIARNTEHPMRTKT